MLLSIQSWRTIAPLLAVGVILLLVSVFLVGRDMTFARNEAEAEVLAFAETSALAIQFAPGSELEPYLARLLKHPAIAMATVYSSGTGQTTRRRPPGDEPPFMKQIMPLGEPIVGCRAVGAKTLCIEADPAYYRRRFAALLIPHAVLLAASSLLLLVAIVLARGSNRRQLVDFTRILSGAAEDSNYALRATEAKGPVGDLARSINRLLEQMHQRDLILRRRTTDLESVNREVEAFSYSVSHDLRGPLASLDGFTQALSQDYGPKLDETGQEYVRWIRDAVTQMSNLIAGLLQMSRASRSEIHRARVDLTEIAQSIAQSLSQRSPARSVDFRIEAGLIADGDERLLHAVLENLMSNAFKFTSKKDDALVAVGSTTEDGRPVYFVRDNGAGFDSTQAAKMFTAFQRLHSQSEFEGTGIGLATVKRIIERHGGAIWADSQVGQGATFYFTTGEDSTAGDRDAATVLTGTSG